MMRKEPRVILLFVCLMLILSPRIESIAAQSEHELVELFRLEHSNTTIPEPIYSNSSLSPTQQYLAIEAGDIWEIWDIEARKTIATLPNNGWQRIA